MDSQVTLISTSSLSHLVLVFEGDVACNAIVRVAGDTAVLYTIASTNGGARTAVCDARGGLVAEFRFRAILRDQVTFPDQPAMPFSSWLSSRGALPMSFVSGQARYVWRSCRGRRLMLFREDGSVSEPIAQFERARPSSGAPAQLSLAADAKIVQDLIVSSLVILERDLQLNGPMSGVIGPAAPVRMPLPNLQLRI